MMEKVALLEGTGRKAILEGYTSAGKTGTAQKVDPATGAYSKTKYIGSFAGFAPLNNPQIVVAVILDSAVGLHQGGQVSAPVFRRVAQQVLEYLHTPHDLPLAPQHQLLLAQAKMKDKDLEEGTPDHPGEPLETAEVNGESLPAAGKVNVARALSPATAGGEGNIIPAAMREAETTSAAASQLANSAGHEHRKSFCGDPTPVDRNGSPGRRARRNRSPIVHRQDRPRSCGSCAGCWPRTRSRRKRSGAAAVPASRDARGCGGPRDGAVREVIQNSQMHSKSNESCVLSSSSVAI